jgi:hypothetical protein
MHGRRPLPINMKLPSERQNFVSNTVPATRNDDIYNMDSDDKREGSPFITGNQSARVAKSSIDNCDASQRR